MGTRRGSEWPRGAAAGAPWPAPEGAPHSPVHPARPSRRPPSTRPLPEASSRPPHLLSLRVREAHAQRSVPGQPFSPASFTPANTHHYTRARAHHSPASPAAPWRIYVVLCVCVREKQRRRKWGVEEGACAPQPRRPGSQLGGHAQAAAPPCPSRSPLQKATGPGTASLPAAKGVSTSSASPAPTCTGGWSQVPG